MNTRKRGISMDMEERKQQNINEILQIIQSIPVEETERIKEYLKCLYDY